MRQRIRAAVILMQEDRMLLVKHADPDTGAEWWIPPGGGLLETDRSIADCAIREVMEETGLEVRLVKLVYLREFASRHENTHHIELFFLGETTGGQLTLENIRGSGPDEEYIQAVDWLDRRQMQELTVYPEHLLDGFWDDLAAGFPEARYLGLVTE